MDDDIGLFDYPLDKFASVFHECLLSNNIHLENQTSSIYEDKQLNLFLTYAIDGGLLEGRLRVRTWLDLLPTYTQHYQGYSAFISIYYCDTDHLSCPL